MAGQVCGAGSPEKPGVARLLLGLPRPPSVSANGAVREQEGALWCLLKRQVSLHMCRQGSWKREAGAGCTLRPGGGTRVQRLAKSPWWGSRGVAPGCAVRVRLGAAQSVRSPWGPCRQQRAQAQARQSELQKALSEQTEFYPCGT